MPVRPLQSNSTGGLNQPFSADATSRATTCPASFMFCKRIFLFIAIFGFAVSTCIAAPPKVSGVEPPNWWVGHSHNPVRLLISGQNLSGARVEAPAGFQVDLVHASDNGTYMFVDFHIPEVCPPGEVPLRVTGKDGEDRVLFQLLPPLAREGRVQGISTDDVIYLLMTDRFANGDPSNDDPTISPGLHDRNRPRRYHGGDFQGVLDHLDYLRGLGVTTLLLTPWYDNVNHLNYIQQDELDSLVPEPTADYHGYGVVDFYGTEEHFGNLLLLQKLVDRAHDMGMKVIQDQVVNNTSPYHPWVTNPPTPTWFNGSVTDHFTNTYQTWSTVVSNPPPDRKSVV